MTENHDEQRDDRSLRTLALLRSELVEHRGWLTETQLLDAVAFGQVTPGPVITTATFIGYVLGGLPGSSCRHSSSSRSRGRWSQESAPRRRPVPFSTE